MRINKFVLIVLLSTFSQNLFAQIPGNSETNSGKVTIVHTSEINSAAETGKGRAVADSVLRVISIGEKYNVSDSCIRKWCKKECLPFTKKEIRKLIQNNKVV